MKRNFIDFFFTELDREARVTAQVIITGAAAGSLLGHVRPSVDIDFEIRARPRKRGGKSIGASIDAITSKTGIAANYAEDISRWSMIDFLDYRKKAIAYKKIGRLDVKLMAPAYWTIGKMTRYLEIDIHDVTKIIRRKKLKPGDLVLLWGKALRASPLSLASRQFRDHVEDFLKRFGKSLWGKRFDSRNAIQTFRKIASHVRRKQ